MAATAAPGVVGGSRKRKPREKARGTRTPPDMDPLWSLNPLKRLDFCLSMSGESKRRLVRMVIAESSRYREPDHGCISLPCFRGVVEHFTRFPGKKDPWSRACLVLSSGQPVVRKENGDFQVGR